MKTIYRMFGIAVLSLLFSVTGCAADSNYEGVANQKAVLVTGASTGIGRKITAALAAEGYFCLRRRTQAGRPCCVERDRERAVDQTRCHH